MGYKSVRGVQTPFTQAVSSGSKTSKPSGGRRSSRGGRKGR